MSVSEKDTLNIERALELAHENEVIESWEPIWSDNNNNKAWKIYHSLGGYIYIQAEDIRGFLLGWNLGHNVGRVTR